MSVIELLCDALRKALWFFSVIIIVVAVVLYHLEDPDSTKYDRYTVNLHVTWFASRALVSFCCVDLYAR